jgi:hypothetical protein
MDISFGKIALLGAAMALGGISQLMSPAPKQTYNNKKTSWLFDGAVNSSDQGGPIPVVAGKFTVPGILISGGIEVQGSVKGVPIDQLVGITADGPAGSIKPYGVMEVNTGTDITFKIKSPGWPQEVTDVIVDSVHQGAISSYTFHSISGGSHHITVICSPVAGSQGSA